MYIDIFNTTKKYKTLYLDPPWSEQGGGAKSSAAQTGTTNL